MDPTDSCQAALENALISFRDMSLCPTNMTFAYSKSSRASEVQNEECLVMDCNCMLFKVCCEMLDSQCTIRESAPASIRSHVFAFQQSTSAMLRPRSLSLSSPALPGGPNRNRRSFSDKRPGGLILAEDSGSELLQRAMSQHDLPAGGITTLPPPKPHRPRTLCSSQNSEGMSASSIDTTSNTTTDDDDNMTDEETDIISTQRLEEEGNRAWWVHVCVSVRCQFDS